MTPPTLTPAARAALEHLAQGGELVRDADGWHYGPEDARAVLSHRDAATLSAWQLIARDWAASGEDGYRYHITDRGREALR